MYGAPGRDPDKRPGSVTAAGVVTIILSGLSTLLYGGLLIGLLVARDSLVDEFESQPGFEDVSADDVLAIFAVVLVIAVVWSLIATILGVMVLKRSNVARIPLAISCGSRSRPA